MDNLTKKDQRDRSKINMHEAYEVKYWTRELGVSREDLQKVVDKVGNSAATVRKELGFMGERARSEAGHAGWCTPELLRIKGRRLLQQGGRNRDGAEALMLRSIETARRQGALSWELRTAISLAEHWRSEDRHSQAADLLALTFNGFTEGFETADLVRARDLLKNLRASA